MRKNYDFLLKCYDIKWIVLFQFQKCNVELYIEDNMLENHHNLKHMERTTKNH